MAEAKKWYAIYTKIHREKTTAALLERKNIETFCPLQKKVSQWSDRKKILMQPLFTSYVFVRASISEHLIIRQTSGVLNFVYWLGKPAVIRDEEIVAIQTFMRQHADLRLERIGVKINDRVRVMHGPIAMQEGRVVKLGNATVKIALPTLGFVMVAEINKKNVEVLV
jgi:transcription antitermination factor NusG